MSEQKDLYLSQRSHTPGPWRVEELEPPRFIITATDATVEILIAGCNANNANNEANARLIAAAPELLKACQALQMEAAARGCGLRIADEAIEKAEGQS